ncbi:hypothetical protein ANCCAN_28272, partial [Ancylostoma caninum]
RSRRPYYTSSKGRDLLSAIIPIPALQSTSKPSSSPHIHTAWTSQMEKDVRRSALLTTAQIISKFISLIAINIYIISTDFVFSLRSIQGMECLRIKLTNPSTQRFFPSFFLHSLHFKSVLHSAKTLQNEYRHQAQR